MSARYKVDDPNQNTPGSLQVVEAVEEEDEEELSGLERLLKRRRISGDNSVRQATNEISEVEIEMQNYEALPVRNFSSNFKLAFNPNPAVKHYPGCRIRVKIVS